MFACILRRQAVLMLSFLLVSLSPARAAEPIRLTLGVFPGVESGELESFQILDRYLPFAQYLTVKSGVEVLVLPVRVPHAAMRRMSEGTGGYKLFFGPPVFASNAIKRAKYLPLVVERDRIRGNFVVRHDSPLRTLSDIDAKSTRVVLPSPTLLLSILAQETLAQAKIVSKETQHMASIQAMTLSLDNGASDVMVIRDRSAQKLLAENPGKHRIIGNTVDAPGFAVIAHSSVPEALRAKLIDAAVKLSTDNSPLAAELRANLRAGPFVPSKGDDFAGLQRMVETWSTGPAN
jgi:ABC-type phosphate/phosphonate transport system substrate-binding protein